MYFATSGWEVLRTLGRLGHARCSLPWQVDRPAGADVLIHPEDIARIPLVLERHQSCVRFRVIAEPNMVAALILLEIEVDTTCLVRPEPVGELLGPGDMRFVLRRVLPTGDGMCHVRR